MAANYFVVVVVLSPGERLEDQHRNGKLTSGEDMKFVPDHHQVHADASNFKAGITKADAYAQVLEQARALFDGQRNWVW